MVEPSLFDGPIYFNCNADLTIKTKNKNILRSLELEIKLDGFNMLPRSCPAAAMIRVYYKILNILEYIGVVNKRTLGSTDYFQIDPKKCVRPKNFSLGSNQII